MTQILSVNKDTIENAAIILKGGGLVGMPTETVYGLAANARNGKAVAKIFEAKGRPSFNPLIVHVNEIEDVRRLAHMNAQEETLAKIFWPGPLTMILQRREDNGLSDLVTAGLPTVAVRIPTHKTARALIKACGFPLAAPSANASGTLSPTAPAHVAASLGDKVDIILADGVCAVGLESTVVDCSGKQILILRPGGITAEDIAQALGQDVVYDLGDKDGADVKSPGQLLKHYAPNIPVRLNAIDVEEGEALLAFGSTRFMSVRGKGGVSNLLSGESLKNLSEDGDLYEAASNLFSMLRALDNPLHTRIAVMAVPNIGVGVAINDRLRRAAQV